MAKKGGKKVNPADMTDAQKAAFQAQLALQERALEMAQAQADRDYESYLRRLEQQRADAAAAQQQAAEDEQRAAQFAALGRVAEIYGGRVGQIGSQYDINAKQLKDLTESALSQIASELSGRESEIGSRYDAQSARVEAQRLAALQQLAEAVQSGETTIGEAEQALLRDLVATRAYQDVPLVELGQIQNPLLAGLAAEGASAAGVESETAQSQQAANQLAALTRGAMRQLNVGEENYLRALQNAGRFAATQSRQDLAGRQFAVGQGIRSQYDQLASEIANQRAAEFSAAQSRAAESRGQQQSAYAQSVQSMDAQRASDIAAAQLAAAQAQAQQGAYAPIVRPAPMPTMPEPAFDYAAQLEAARKAALASIRAALPPVAAPPPAVTTTGKPPAVTTTGKPADKKKGKKGLDPWSGTPTYIPNEMV